MKHFEFENGSSMPMLGLGTWLMLDGSAYEAVKTAIEIGYRHIDCAWIYLNETDIGRAIKDCIDGGVVTRGDLWITTKLWNDCHRAEHVEKALQQQLKNLQLEYVDLYLIHWPVAHQYQVVRPESADQFLSLDEVPLTETWSAMLECVGSGLSRHAGVANFSRKKVDQLITETGVAPACVQVECHPYLQQNTLLNYCTEKDIAFVAYSPLGSGSRPDRLKKHDEPNLFEIEVVQEIASSHGATAAQVLLAWLINRGAIPIPKSSNPQRQKENLQSVHIDLTEQQMVVLSELDQSYRFVDGKFWEIPGGPYQAIEIWDE